MRTTSTASAASAASAMLSMGALALLGLCLSGCEGDPRPGSPEAAADRRQLDFDEAGIGGVSGTAPRSDEAVGFHPATDGSAHPLQAQPMVANQPELVTSR